MTDKQFQEVVKRRLGLIEAVLAHKAKEYARGDRLHNFKRAAETLRCTPEKACVGFLMKHLVWIMDMVDDCEKAGGPGNKELWDEKIGDAINYLVLLEAIVSENL